MNKVLIPALSMILLTAQVYAGYKKPDFRCLYSEAIEMYRRDAFFWYSEHQKICKRLNVIGEIKKTVWQNLQNEYHDTIYLLNYNIALQNFLQTSHAACIAEIKSAQNSIAQHKKITNWPLPPDGKSVSKKEHHAFTQALQSELHDTTALVKWMTTLARVQKECEKYFGQEHMSYLKALDERLLELQQKLILESQ